MAGGTKTENAYQTGMSPEITFSASEFFPLR